MLGEREQRKHRSIAAVGGVPVVRAQFKFNCGSVSECVASVWNLKRIVDRVCKLRRSVSSEAGGFTACVQSVVGLEFVWLAGQSKSSKWSTVNGPVSLTSHHRPNSTALVNRKIKFRRGKKNHCEEEKSLCIRGSFADHSERIIQAVHSRRRRAGGVLFVLLFALVLSLRAPLLRTSTQVF